MTLYEALQKAVETAGSQSELARRCDTYQVRVSRWMSAGRVQAEFVLAVEAATGISRHDLRPDIYPRPSKPNQRRDRRTEDQALTDWDRGEYANQFDILDYTQGATL